MADNLMMRMMMVVMMVTMKYMQMPNFNHLP